jgi:endonuclease-8
MAEGDTILRLARGIDAALGGCAGRPCRVCGTPIRSRGQGDANRTTYWCQQCQV